MIFTMSASNSYYKNGTDTEVQNAFKILNISKYGYDSSKKISIIFKKVMNNNYDINILSSDDKEALNQIQDDLSLDWKLFFGIYDDFSRPMQILVQYRNETISKQKG